MSEYSILGLILKLLIHLLFYPVSMKHLSPTPNS